MRRFGITGGGSIILIESQLLLLLVLRVFAVNMLCEQLLVFTLLLAAYVPVSFLVSDSFTVVPWIARSDDPELELNRDEDVEEEEEVEQEREKEEDAEEEHDENVDRESGTGCADAVDFVITAVVDADNNVERDVPLPPNRTSHWFLGVLS
jgi:hypothetical protein